MSNPTLVVEQTVGRAGAESRADAFAAAPKMPLKAKWLCFLATSLLLGGLLAGQAHNRYGLFGMRAGKAAMAARGLALPGQEPEGSLNMGIFVGERRVGELRQEWHSQDAALIVTSRMAISVDALAGHFPAGNGPGPGDLDVVVLSRATLMGERLEALFASASIGRDETAFATVFIQRNGDKVSLLVRSGERADKSQVVLPPEGDIDLACFPLVALPPLRAGMKWPVSSLDPLTMRVKHSVARVRGRENLPGPAGGQAFVVRIGDGGTGATLWAAEDGRILRKTVMGMTFVREEAAPACLAIAVKEGAR